MNLLVLDPAASTGYCVARVWTSPSEPTLGKSTSIVINSKSTEINGHSVTPIIRTPKNPPNTLSKPIVLTPNNPPNTLSNPIVLTPNNPPNTLSKPIVLTPNNPPNTLSNPIILTPNNPPNIKPNNLYKPIKLIPKISSFTKKIYPNKSYLEIIAYDFIDVDTSSEYPGDHCIDLMNQIRTIIEEHDIQDIAIEDYYYNKRFATGSKVNVAYRTAIHILARQLKIPYMILNISSWKSYVAGRASPTKDQKEKWGKEASKKIFIQDSLWKKYQIRFPNHSLSTKTQRPIKFRNDIVDATAMCIYYAHEYHKIDHVTCSVVVPEDHEFTSLPKGTYIYE